MNKLLITVIGILLLVSTMVAADDNYAHWDKPYRLVYGGYSKVAGEGDWDIWEGRFNMVHEAFIPLSKDSSYIVDTFKQARERRMKIIDQVSNTIVDANGVINATELAKFQAFYNTYGSDETLFGYIYAAAYLLTPAQQLGIYNAIKSVDPTRPVWSEYSSTGYFWPNFEPNSCDAILSYNYPYEQDDVGDWNDPNLMVGRVTYSVDAINQYNTSNKPVICLMQAFGQTSGGEWRMTPQGGIQAQYNKWTDLNCELAGVSFYRWRNSGTYIGYPSNDYPYLWDDIQTLVIGLAGGINIADIGEFGGFAYFGEDNKYPGGKIAENDFEMIFDGDRYSGMWGAAGDTVPSELYRCWGQDVNLSRITLEGGWRTDVSSFDQPITDAEAFYRDADSNWVSIGLLTGGTYSVSWENLGGGSGIVTDAIKIETRIPNWAIINNVTAFGQFITPASLTNLASHDQISPSDANLTVEDVRNGNSDALIDESKTTWCSFYNSSHTPGGYWELDWGQDMLLNAILVSGGPGYGAVADIEIYDGAWHKVESGSTGTSGFSDSFRDGVPNRGWGGGTNLGFGGGEFHGTSLRFGNYVTASKIRLTNFNTAYETSSGGVNFLREIRVYGLRGNPADCIQVWQDGYGISGDTNQDCNVDFGDIDTLADTWLNSTEP